MSKKIVTKQRLRFGRKLGFAIDGVKEVDEKGVVELSDEGAELMVTRGSGWAYLDGSVSTKKVDKKVQEEIKKVEEAVAEVCDDEEEINSRMDIIGQNGNEGLHYEEETADLDSMSAKELREVLKSADLYQAKIHAKASKKKLIEFIKENLQ